MQVDSLLSEHNDSINFTQLMNLESTSIKRKKRKKEDQEFDPIINKKKKKKISRDKLSDNKILQPFWNKYSKKISKKLPSRMKKDYPKYFNDESSCNLMSNSWFRVKTNKMKSVHNRKWIKKLFPSLIPIDDEKEIKLIEEEENNNSTVNETKKMKKIHPPMKVIKYRVYPSKKQIEILKSWFGVARWTYNQCVHYVYENKKTSYSKKELREKFINNENFEQPDKTWITKVPYAIRDAAMTDLLKAIDTHKAKKKKNKTTFFLHYRSKKRNPIQSITISKQHWIHTRGKYSKVLGYKTLKTSKTTQLPKELPADSRLIINQLQHYYLCVPQPIMIKPMNESPLATIVSIDPGVRTFVTTYDDRGRISEWGHYDNKHIMRMAIHIDQLISLRASKKKSTIRHRTRYKLKKIIQRMKNKMRNRIDEVHKKCSTWLCENYQNIILPIFTSREMVNKQDRRINNTTVRQMLSWSHYRFQQRIKHKVREYPSCNLILTTEEYTSITCGKCGELNNTLGSSKKFRCPTCNFKINRDHNGARNVMIKYLSSLLLN